MFSHVLFLKIANEKPKLEGEWKAEKDKKKWQGQEVTNHFFSVLVGEGKSQRR